MNLLKRFSLERLRGKKRSDLLHADNIHGSATSGIGITSQMLSLYSGVQKRARFALYDEHMKPICYIEHIAL